VFARVSDGPTLLYTVRANGTHLRRIGRGDEPVWSSAGQIAFTRDRHNGDRNSIYTSTATGKNLRRLTYGRNDATPDWQRLVFQRERGIASVGAGGGDLRTLTQNPRTAGPAYSPDGTQIVFAAGGKLVVIPAAGGPGRAYRCEELGCSDPVWLPATTTAGALPNTGTPTRSTLDAGLALLAIGAAARAGSCSASRARESRGLRRSKRLLRRQRRAAVVAAITMPRDQRADHNCGRRRLASSSWSRLNAPG
jgi:Tol biopolymer transport system component